jgi:hypothetical protein
MLLRAAMITLILLAAISGFRVAQAQDSPNCDGVDPEIRSQCIDAYRDREQNRKNTAEPERPAPHRSDIAPDTEAQGLMKTARQCAASTPACAAAGCYDSYKQRFGLNEAIRAEIDRLNRACAESQPFRIDNGVYAGFASGGCEFRRGAVTVTVRQPDVFWRHNGVDWRGTIDASGIIRQASGGNGSSATGQLRQGDSYVEMKYPHCGQVISIKILQKIEDGRER